MACAFSSRLHVGASQRPEGFFAQQKSAKRSGAALTRDGVEASSKAGHPSLRTGSPTRRPFKPRRGAPSLRPRRCATRNSRDRESPEPEHPRPQKDGVPKTNASTTTRSQTHPSGDRPQQPHGSANRHRAPGRRVVRGAPPRPLADSWRLGRRGTDGSCGPPPVARIRRCRAGAGRLHQT